MPEIIKRNGKRERFEAYKVQQAIEKAFHASHEDYNPLVYANVMDTLKTEENIPVNKICRSVRSCPRIAAARSGSAPPRRPCPTSGTR